MTQQPNNPPKEMTPQEALSILDQAASQAPLNRASHVVAQQAVQTIAKLLQELDQLKAGDKED